MLADATAMIAAGFVGTTVHWLCSDMASPELFGLWANYGAGTSLLIYGLLLLTAIAWLRLRGHYSRRRPLWDETREVVQIVAILALLDATLLFSGKVPFSRLWWFGTWASAGILIPMVRTGWKQFLLKRGLWQRPVLILGCGPNAVEAMEALRSEPLMGFNVVAFARLSSDPEEDHAAEKVRLPVINLTQPLDDLRPFPSLNLVVAMEADEIAPHMPFLNRLQRSIAHISVVPALKGLPLYGLEASHFFRHEALFLTLRNDLGRRGPQALKRLFDVVGSIFLLVVLFPLLAYIFLRIRISGGSAFFGHKRVGRGGSPFLCYKFRTMVPDAEQRLTELLATDPAARQEWTRDFKLRNDPRITPVGAFLRRRSLDELPQLWNVLKGEMSLVGPRPVVEDELSRYGEDVDYYLECRPGMTGLWQISGRNNTDYRDRVHLDTWYARNWSLWQDLVILLKSIRVVSSRHGAY